jgi:endonuclease/exonuclease/phosphatase family metal-dependent hydrolase
MRECGLRDLNSFYKHKSVNTRASTFNDLVFKLDHFLARPQGKKLTIIDTKVTTECAQSDHLPVRLNLKIRAK